MFFEKEDNHRVLSRFIFKAGATNLQDEILQMRLSLSLRVVDFIFKSPSNWDERCEFSIGRIGTDLLALLEDFNKDEESFVDEIFVLTFQFLCEFDFYSKGAEPSTTARTRIKAQMIDQAEHLSEIERSSFNNAAFELPINIIKQLLDNSNIQSFKSFEQKVQEAEALREHIGTELKSRVQEIESLKNALSEYKTGFNFVGLNQGFQDLAEKKKKEALQLFVSIVAMGIIVLIPLCFSIYLSYENFSGGGSFSTSMASVLLPIFSIEIVLIYFFRIVLLNHRSVKAQIIQLELRQALCQFIQDYADYSSEIKSKDKSALEKFENLIFSGLLSDPDKLPSTFDGIDQLSKLIKNVKS